MPAGRETCGRRSERSETIDTKAMKPGSRWRSVRCTTEVLVVRRPKESVSLGCGGSEMVPLGADGPAVTAPDVALAEGCQLGKRYVEESVGIEVLCTKAGQGSLTVDGKRLAAKDAKPLPASD